MYFNDKHIYVLSLDTYFLFVYLAEIILLKLLYLSNFFKNCLVYILNNLFLKICIFIVLVTTFKVMVYFTLLFVS